MKPDEAAKVLRQFNDWRTDKNIPTSARYPSVRDITAAIDAAVAALEAVASAKPVAWRWLLMDGQPDSDRCFPGEGPSADVAERARDNKGVYMPRVPQLLFAGPQPAFCCAKCGLPDLKTPHPRERVLAEDAARGNFRRAIPSGQDGIDGVHATDIIPAAAIVGDDDGAAIIQAGA